MPNAIVAPSHEPNPRGVAAHVPNPPFEPEAPHLRQPQAQHLAREVHADHGAARRAARSRPRGRPCRDRARGRPVQRQRIHGDVAPAAVQSALSTWFSRS
jgi:hypothetical protein